MTGVDRVRAVKGGIKVSRAGLAAGIGLFLLITPVAALADDDYAQVFAGGQAAFSNYVYMGATVAMPGASIGNGFALRGYVDAGGYNYISSDLGKIRANFGGGEMDAVYQFSSANKSFWSDFGVGANDTYTNLVPFDPSNRRAGQQVELRVNLDGGTVSGPYEVDWIGYYGTRLDDYAARIGATHSLSSQWRLGAEVYGEGDPTYRLYEVGPYAGLRFGKRSELQFSGGETWQSGFTPRAYVRALIYQAF
jgi:hypothetical protein